MSLTLSAGQPPRLGQLDVLRFGAALVVMAEHLRNSLAPTLLETLTGDLRGLVIAAASNGHLAVCVFFVMSGYVVRLSAEARQAHPLGLLAGRLVRLGWPLALTTGLILLAVATGRLGQTSVAVAEAAGLHLRYPPEAIADWGPLWPLIDDGTLGALLGYGAHATINGVFWTLPYEVWGTGLIILLLLRLPLPVLESRAIMALMLGAGIVLTGALAYFALIWLGAWLVEVPRTRWWQRWRRRLPDRLPAPAAVAGIGALWLLGREEQLVDVVLAPLILLLALWHGPCRRLPGLVAWMGRVTFPLYLLHVPLIEIVLVPALLATQSHATALSLYGASLALAVLTLWAIGERPAMAWGRHVQRRLDQLTGS